MDTCIRSHTVNFIALNMTVEYLCTLTILQDPMVTNVKVINIGDVGDVTTQPHVVPGVPHLTVQAVAKQIVPTVITTIDVGERCEKYSHQFVDTIYMVVSAIEARGQATGHPMLSFNPESQRLKELSVYCLR